MSNFDGREKLQKLYFRIGEVAGIVGVEPHVLRYWEGEFRSIRPQKSARGQRVYSRRDVEALLKVKELLYSHRFTIAGAKRRLREGGPEPVVESEAALSREAAPIVDLAPTTAAPPAPRVIAVEELQAVYARLVTLRDRARTFLSQVDHWGNDPNPP